MAEEDDAPEPQADLYAVNAQGEKTDTEVMEALLGDEDFDDSAYEHVIWGDGTEDGTALSYREKLPFLLRGNENSGNHDHEGRPGQVGGSAPSGGGEGHVAMRPATKDDAERVAKLRVPPQYRDSAMLSEDPTSELQATWTDAKGRTQYRYSAEHTKAASAAKFERLSEFNEALPALREQIVSDIGDTSLPEEEREAALALYLIDKTGFRPGGAGDTGADKKAYGVTTLKAGHVPKIDGDKISFRFPSKSGQSTSKTITDPLLAKELKPRKEKGGEIFNTSDAKLRDYLHKRAGDFKVKDLRTWNGTNKAIETIKKMPVPKTEKAFKKAQREVAKAVAKHLGNTPAVALSSYIDPRVFSKWKVKAE